MAIYLLTLFIGMIISSLSFAIFYTTQIRNTSFWKSLFQKYIKIPTEKELKKSFYDFFIFRGGMAVGACLLAYVGILILTAFQVSFLLFSTPLVNGIEKTIVYLDYRPKDKITECINLKDGEWGLLVGTNKINVANPQSTGGYIFKTSTCIFN
jgi:hypothetical protein